MITRTFHDINWRVISPSIYQSVDWPEIFVHFESDSAWYLTSPNTCSRHSCCDHAFRRLRQVIDWLQKREASA